MGKSLIDKEDKLILDTIKKNASSAFDSTLKANMSATILKGRSIVTIFPDGTEKLVVRLDRPTTKRVTKRVFSLK